MPLQPINHKRRLCLLLLLQRIPILPIRHPPLVRTDRLVLPTSSLPNLSPSHYDGGLLHLPLRQSPDVMALRHRLQDVKHPSRQPQQVHGELRSRLPSSLHLKFIA